MSEKYCDKKNPLVRNGTSIPERMPDALKGDYVRIDERTISDFLFFINNFARHIKYYSLQNKHFGSWAEFFSGDVSVLIAKIAGKRTSDYLPYFKEIQDLVELEKATLADTSDIPEKIPSLKEMFDFMFSLYAQLDQEIHYLPQDFAIKEYALKTIKKDFSTSFIKLSGIYKAGIDLGLINPDQKITNIVKPPVDLLFAQEFLKRGVDGVWFGNDSQTLDDFYQSLDDSAYHAYYKAPTSPYSVQDIRFMVEAVVKQLSDIFDKSLKSIASIISQSQDFLQQTITKCPDHKPHVAMLISFLHLYDILKNQLNDLGASHIAFYYKDVLRLKNKKAVPNYAHLVIELAKNTPKLSLPVGTPYKAGKDEGGKDILYEQTREFSLNKTQVAELRGILKSGGVFAATPVLKSMDGLGDDPVKENISWSPFGVDTLPANIGFAIASPILYLQEGERTITVTLSLEETISTLGLGTSEFKAYITLEKEWSELLNLVSISLLGGDKIELTISLSPEEPAVFPFNPAFHSDLFEVLSPVLKIILNEAATNYEKLKDIHIKKIDLNVDVKGIKNLHIQNNLGALDPSRPFMPFGPQPNSGSSLIIGSNEIFQKPLTALYLNVEWDGLPDSLDEDIKASVAILKEGKWVAEEKIITLFHSDPKVVEKYDLGEMQTNIRLKVFSYQSIGNFNIHKKSGYIKLELGKPDFGHKDYPAKYIEAIVKFANKKGGVPSDAVLSVPNQPYTPVLKLLTLDYEAEDTIDLSVSPEINSGQYFHVHPFGVAKTGISGTLPTILPDYKSEGEMYLGLEHVSPDQYVSILFQLDEGTANPLKEQPAINWSYLNVNQWLPFDKNKGEVMDETNSLIQSGIIQIKLPEKPDTNNSLLPEGFFWIRASIENNQDAASRIVDVIAQAIKVKLVLDGDRNEIIKNQLEPGTIAKMLRRNAAVKGIQQPYSTYYGKPEPAPEAFNLAVSERLRHKNRAISIWDYERLVLENFSEIFKVRCLNHTRVVEKMGKNRDYERFPGHITITVIPRITEKTSFYLNRPYASLATLNRIEEFLKTKTSPFVQLRVMNPKFEPIKVELDVAFYKDKDPDVYKEVLKKDISEFLSPWAYEASAIAQMRFGGSMQKSLILKYIEDRDYVDFITDFKIYHFTDEGEQETEVDEAIASTARSILVSYENHKIHLAVACDA